MSATTGITREGLLRRKPVDAFVTETKPDAEGGELRRGLGLFQLTTLGIGATIGTGIFIVLSDAVPTAGPAVILSFVLAGITAGLTAVCYAELASMIPVSGSSYSYAYATLGEIVAWGVGACLILEYGIATAAVSVGWGEYLNELFSDLFGFRMAESISAAPGAGGVVNIPAMVLVSLCALLLLRGARESAGANAVMVIIKVTVLLMFIVIAFTAFDSDNLEPFTPNGVSAVGTAASAIFFSYIGLDAVSTAGEEVRNPRRNLPLAIIIALITVTTVYVLVAISGVGAQPWQQFEGQEAGLAAILRNVTGSDLPAIILSAGAVISIFSVTLVGLYGQTRILFAMGRDGMLPEVFHRVDPRTLTPVINTIIVAIFVALIAGFVPLDVLINLTSMGTLVAFTVVSVGVMILRRTQPDMPRGFRVPLYPVVPLASIAFCIYLIQGLPLDTFWLFGLWLLGAALIYVFYGARHSRLNRAAGEAGP